MEDSFQFIIESPQHNTGHKKRPRLVTSCDNCRLKKIKCLQPSPESKCEACKAAKIPCKFRDREKYFAERSRAIAGPSIPPVYGAELRHESNSTLDAFSVASSSSSPSLSSTSNPRSNSHSPKASGLVSAESEPNGRYHYPSESRRSDLSHKHSNNSSISSFHSRNGSSIAYNFVGSPPPMLQHHHNSRLPSHQPDYRHVQLFDPDRPQSPHSTLMPHFIQLFFEHIGSEFTFLTYEEVIGDFWDQHLSPVLSNCIAAMASRYSNIPELAVRGLHNVAEAYTDSAKTILTSVGHVPTMETLHAIMLLSWAEYKNNRLPGFRAYCQMAMGMAMDLGLSDQNGIQMHPSETERHRRRSTWASIVQLHLTASARA